MSEHVKIEIYSKEWCPYCRRSKALLESKDLDYVEYDIDTEKKLQKEMVERTDGEKTVPQIFINNENIGGYDGLIDIETSGRLDELLNLEKDDYTDQTWDLIIVGAGPAGLSAALYAVRKGLDILLVSTAMGGQVLETDIVDNYLAAPDTAGPDLMHSFWQHARKYDFPVMLGEEVKQVKDECGYRLVLTASEKQLRSKTVLITSGTQKRKMGVPGENELRNKGVHYCAICDGFMYSGQPVAVVGGGNSGLEASLDMNKINSQVSLVEINDSLMGDEVLKRKVHESDLIDVYTYHTVLEVKGKDSVEKLVIQNTNTGKTTNLDVDAVFVEIGLIPNSGIVSDLVKTNDRKEIIVNKKNETSIEGIWAAGDVSNIPDKQILIAAAEGAKAALRINEYLK